MKLIPLFKKIKLNKAQEDEYKLTIENEIKQNLWIIVVLILLFQIYNMFYVGIYTDFTFASVASKVYMTMYAVMMAVCILTLLIIAFKKRKGGKITGLQYFFVLFLILWSLIITVYDNRVSNNINVYIISLLGIAILTYIPPKFFVPLYVIANIALIYSISYFYPGDYTIHYSLYLNSVSLTLMALFISYYRYQSTRQSFLNNYIIRAKNKTIVENSARLDFVAHHDSLTKLLNRRYLTKYLETIYQKNSNLPQKTGVLIIDIDDFKKYNDYFGHVKGDRCLERVANALTLCLSEGVLIRYGGEEFVYINENITLERLQVIGDELCQAIEQLDLTVPPNVARKCVTVSVGGTTGIIKDEESWLEVLNTADEALYMAKKKGKSKCICK